MHFILIVTTILKYIIVKIFLCYSQSNNLHTLSDLIHMYIHLSLCKLYKTLYSTVHLSNLIIVKLIRAYVHMYVCTFVHVNY